jgi:hypothetical protein
MRTLIAAAILAAAGLALAAHAQQDAPAAPVVHKQSGIDYVSGGATPDEAKAMQRVANKYPMQLRFVIGDDPNAGKGVRVTVINLKGEKLIEAVSDGPVFYFNPPSGRWTIDAEYQGETQSKTVDLVGRRYIGLQFVFGGAGG